MVYYITSLNKGHTHTDLEQNELINVAVVKMAIKTCVVFKSRTCVNLKLLTSHGCRALQNFTKSVPPNPAYPY